MTIIRWGLMFIYDLVRRFGIAVALGLGIDIGFPCRRNSMG